MTDEERAKRFMASLDDPTEPNVTVSRRALEYATQEQAKGLADSLRRRADELERDWEYMQSKGLLRVRT